MNKMEVFNIDGTISESEWSVARYLLSKSLLFSQLILSLQIVYRLDNPKR